MALYVDIEKKCGDFELKVKFETADEVFSIPVDRSKGWLWRECLRQNRM